VHRSNRGWIVEAAGDEAAGLGALFSSRKKSAAPMSSAHSTTALTAKTARLGPCDFFVSIDERLVHDLFGSSLAAFHAAFLRAFLGTFGGTGLDALLDASLGTGLRASGRLLHCGARVFLAAKRKAEGKNRGGQDQILENCAHLTVSLLLGGGKATKTEPSEILLRVP
jgi:hypothetical protein